MKSNISIVSPATLALVADSGYHDGLVDPPFGTSLVSRFGLERRVSGFQRTIGEEKNTYW